jgi:hypothetical protein
MAVIVTSTNKCLEVTDSFAIRMYSLAWVFVKIGKSSFITWQHTVCPVLYTEDLKNVIGDFKNYKPDDTIFIILGYNTLLV